MSILGMAIMGAVYIKAVIAAVATNPAKNNFFTALLLELNLTGISILDSQG
jgi:hypothetical protein